MPNPWEQVADIPPYKDLTRARDKELSEELRPLLARARPSTRCAVKKMISYVSITRGIPFEEVRLEHLLERDVGEAGEAYGDHWRQLSIVFQKFLFNETGRRTRPLRNIKYSTYHPSLLQWTEEKKQTVRHTIVYRTNVMRFLGWVTKQYYPGYQPEEFPVALIDRDVLLEYRRHLLRLAERNPSHRVYLKRHMATVVEWTKWLISEQQVAELSLERLAISNGKNRERRVPTDEQVDRLFSASKKCRETQRFCT